MAHVIGDITGIEITPPEDMLEKRVTGMQPATPQDIDEELTKLNEKIAKRGLALVPDSAEEVLLKALNDEDEDVVERTVFSVVLEPNDGEDGVPLEGDTQGDIYSTEAIRKTAHGWMLKGGRIGLLHNLDITDHVAVLETYIAPVDFELNGYKVRKGSWLLKLKILSDVLWEKVKKGLLNAFSVGGTAISEPVGEEAN